MYAANGIGNTFLNVILNIILLPHFRIMGYLMANIIADLVMGLVMFVLAKEHQYLISPMSRKMDRGLSKRMRKYALPLVPQTVCQWIINMSDRYMIILFINTQANGLYAAANKIPNILLIVANPVDILTYTALKLSGYPENRVIGSGTVLDSARLKYHLGEHLGVDSRSVHAFIIGEHGDSEIAAWSSANVSGIPLDKFCEMRGHYNHVQATERIAEEVKHSAYEIISKKGATYYGIAMSVKRICEAIIRDEKSILPISTMMHGEYGISDVVLSMPCIVGRDGYETKVPIDLDQDEVTNLHESANTLRSVIEDSFKNDDKKTE